MDRTLLFEHELLRPGDVEIEGIGFAEIRHIAVRLRADDDRGLAGWIQLDDKRLADHDRPERARLLKIRILIDLELLRRALLLVNN